MMFRTQEGEFCTKMKKNKVELLDQGQAAILKQCEGQTLSYKELTDKLNIKYASGNTKQKQLKELLFYCDYDIIKEGATKYKINGVYEEAVQILSDKKMQAMFDAILFQSLLSSNEKYIYLSGVEMLEIFHEVNKNFSFTFDNNKLISIDKRFEYMADMTQIVYRILRLWTQRRLEDMAKRKLIRIEQGYCLYSTYKIGDNTYQIRTNVPKSTIRKTDDGLDSLCDKVYIDTAKSMFKNITDFGHGFHLSRDYYLNFSEKVNENIKKATNGKYNKLVRITILVLTEKEWIRDKLKEIQSKTNLPKNFMKINEEVCNKILSTSQLKDFNEKERKKYIEYNIKPNPPLYFWQIYNKFKKE